jgi:hypothetical protein
MMTRHDTIAALRTAAILATLIAPTMASAAPVCVQPGPYGCDMWSDPGAIPQDADLIHAKTLCDKPEHQVPWSSGVDLHGAERRPVWKGEWALYCPTVQDRWEKSVEGQSEREHRAKEAEALAWLKAWTSK